MAAISTSLAKSLDALRDSIREATEYLSKTPGADGAYVRVDALCTDDVQAYLEFSEIEGELKLVLTIDPVEQDEAPCALLDLPVSNRIKAAKCLPQLIDLARQKSEELPPEIDAITREIHESLGKGTRLTVTVGQEKSAHLLNVPAVQIGTASMKLMKSKK